MKDQHFDRWQFGDRRPHPVSAKSDGHAGFSTPGISFEDFSRMSTQQRKTTGERRLPTPDWAVDDKKLQHLLVVFMEERAGFRKHKKPLVEKKKDLTKTALLARLEKAKEIVMHRRVGQRAAMRKLNEEYIHLRHQGFLSDAEQTRCRQLENEIQGIDTYLRTSENGTVDVVAACVYLYYRTGMDSVGVAAELGIKPPHVRQTLWRLHRVADYIAGRKRVVPTKEEREARKLARAEKLRLEAEARASMAVERAALAVAREQQRKLAAEERAAQIARAAEERAQRPTKRMLRKAKNRVCIVCGKELPLYAQKFCADCKQAGYKKRAPRLCIACGKERPRCATKFCTDCKKKKLVPRPPRRTLRQENAELKARVLELEAALGKPEPGPVALTGKLPRWLEAVAAAV